MGFCGIGWKQDIIAIFRYFIYLTTSFIKNMRYNLLNKLNRSLVFHNINRA